MQRTALTSAILAFGALALPTLASATPHKSYVLRHPNREHCKAHYVEKVERVKVREHHKTVKVKETFCVYQAPKPAPAPKLTPTFTLVTATEGFSPIPGQPSYKTVNAAVDTYAPAPGNGVVGVPVTVTLVNQATGAVLGSFTETSDGPSCAIAKELSGGNWALKGEAVAGYSGCPMGAVTAPEGQGIGIEGSFAGNAQYAPSASQDQLLV